MIHLIEVIYFLILLTAILRCLYFWQLKEYRWDRFKDFLTTSSRLQFFLPTKHFFRPKLTLKIILLSYLTVYFTILFINFFPHQLIGPILAFFLVPVSVSLSVLLIKPITDLLIDLLIFLAKLKIKLMPKSQIVIGITGSFAKTSTKEILSHVLSAKFKVCKTLGTNNTAIGVALTILKQLKSSHQYLVVEMGAYKKGEIKAICQIVKPKIAIITGITDQHLSLFGSQENLIQAKSELLLALPAKSLAFFNGQNPITQKLAQNFSHLNTILYYYPKNKFTTNLLGDYQQLNLQAAYLVAQKLKLSPKLIRARFTNIPAFKTMLVKKIGLHQAAIIDDSYNANPEGFKAAINYVKTLNYPQKILITSGMIELGSASSQHHQEISKLAQTVFTQIYLTKPDIAKFFPQAQVEPDPGKIIKKLTLNSRTLILLEGRLPQKFILSLCPNQS